MYARAVCVCLCMLAATAACAGAGRISPAVEGIVASQDAEVTSCDPVRPIFEAKNLSTAIPEQPVSGLGLRVCPARPMGCCSRRMEEELRAVVRRDFHALLHHNSRSLEGLLASTAAFVSEHVSQLARQSQNRTLALLAQLYGGAAASARAPVLALYADLLRALDPGPSPAQQAQQAEAAGAAVGAEAGAEGVVYTLGAPADVSVEEAVHTFFAELFPLVYRHGGGAGGGGAGSSGGGGAGRTWRRPLAEEFAACLRATAREVQPFGEVPRQLAHTAARTLEATRVLLQALWLGVEVLNSTDQLPLASDCHAALLRMTFCARCAGLPTAVKPCVGYCLNVLRGCLTAHAGELDLPWNGFVEATERLAEAVKARRPQRLMRSLLARVTEAIMRAAEDAPAVHQKVKRACGPPRFAEGPALPAPPLAHARPDDSAHRSEDPEDEADGEGEAPPLVAAAAAAAEAAAVAADAEAAAAVAASDAGDTGDAAAGDGADGAADPLSARLRLLLASLGRSRGFYANLAESLCSDESFAETRDTADCWNGQRLGEYSKMVVSSGSSAQKYNPELAWTQRTPDPRIAQLSDRLRHIRQVVLSQLTLAPESDSQLHGDVGGAGTAGGGLDGSGSGGGGGERWREDSDDDEWVDQGSGSGAPPSEKGRTPVSAGVDPAGEGGRGAPPPVRDDSPRAQAAASHAPPSTLLLAAAALAAAAASAVAASSAAAFADSRLGGRPRSALG